MVKVHPYLADQYHGLADSPRGWIAEAPVLEERSMGSEESMMHDLVERDGLGRARDWLLRRGARGFFGLLAMSIPMYALGLVASVSFVLMAALFLLKYRLLARRGVLVPVRMKAHYADAAEAWRDESKMLGCGGTVEAHAVNGAFRLAAAVPILLGRILPCAIVHYSFEFNGRTYKVGKYMFSTEAVSYDETDCPWALIDPNWPRLNHWLVTRLP